MAVGIIVIEMNFDIFFESQSQVGFIPAEESNFFDDLSGQLKVHLIL